MDVRLIRDPRARAVLIPASTHPRFKTGSVPGIEASRRETREFVEPLESHGYTHYTKCYLITVKSNKSLISFRCFKIGDHVLTL